MAKPATRTDPAGSASGSRSRRAASTAARMVTAWSASRRPAGVSRTRRPSGSTSGVPASRASAAICCETVDVVVCMASATARIDPSRRQLEEHAEAAEVHAGDCPRSRTVCPSISRGRERFVPASTGWHGPAPGRSRRHRRWRSRRCSASSSGWPSSVGLIDDARRRGRSLAPAGLGRACCCSSWSGRAARDFTRRTLAACVLLGRGDRRASPCSSWPRWPGSRSGRPARWSSSARSASRWRGAGAAPRSGRPWPPSAC